MTLRTTVNPHAEAEFLDAFDHYVAISESLGARFLHEFEHACRAILENPHSPPRAGNRIRARRLKTFPYSIVYSTRPAELRILALAHYKRRPGYWRGRT